VSAVFFYISGHGFGHASREIEIINALGTMRPDIEIFVRTSAPRWLFDRTLRVAVTHLPGEVDTGVVQIDSLRLDEQQTIERAREFYGTLPERAAEDAVLLRDRHAKLVVADVPPLGCAAACAAGVPSVVVGNFTWDWIYEEYAEHLAAAPRLQPTIREAYGKAEAAWRLPMHGGFETFDTIVDVPFVARHARHQPDTVRSTLNLPTGRRLALVSFGGFGLRSFDYFNVDCGDEFDLVLTRDDSESTGFPRWVHTISESALYDLGFRYEDLVGAVDVVVSKPGYGIISECIANGTALLYTSRGRFAEYQVLVEQMPRYLRCQYIPQTDLVPGRWGDALRELMAMPDPVQRVATNGAQVVAGMILERLTRSC
jgi:hypothetical protein